MFYEIEECHTYRGVMLKMLTWLSLSKKPCTLARVHWKVRDVWEDFKETGITMWAHHFSYTPKRRYNLWMLGWKTQETQKLPHFGIWERDVRIWINECYGEISTWNTESCPRFGIHRRILIEQGVLFPNIGIHERWGEKFTWDSQNCPSFCVWRRNWMNKGVVSKEVVEMEMIDWKGLPQLVCFPFACFWLDDKEFSSSWDIIIFSHFFYCIFSFAQF